MIEKAEFCSYEDGQHFVGDQSGDLYVKINRYSAWCYQDREVLSAGTAMTPVDVLISVHDYGHLA